MSETRSLQTTLSISGATCQGCAKRIRAALEPITGDPNLVEVDLENQTVSLPDGVHRDEAARLVSEAGYPAKPITAGHSGSASCCSDQDTSAVPAPAPADHHGQAPGSTISSPDDDEQTALSVTGATCASCVNTIEKALLSVQGVTYAHMNLADNTATASGPADPQALIQGSGKPRAMAPASLKTKTRPMNAANRRIANSTAPC